MTINQLRIDVLLCILYIQVSFVRQCNYLKSDFEPSNKNIHPILGNQPIYSKWAESCSKWGL